MKLNPMEDSILRQVRHRLLCARSEHLRGSYTTRSVYLTEEEIELTLKLIEEATDGNT